MLKRLTTLLKKVFQTETHSSSKSIPEEKAVTADNKNTNNKKNTAKSQVIADQRDYVELYHSLRNNIKIDHSRLVVPFASQELHGYQQAQIKILYVGKATGREWGFDILSFDDLAGNTGIDQFLEQSQFCTRNFLETVKEGGYHSPFWTHARKISEIAERIANDKVGFPDNIVWTNAAKLGVKSGNPQGRYLDVQLSLARRSLLNEIRFYKPDLIYVCTGCFANGENRNNPDIIHNVFGKIDDEKWNKISEDFWWRSGLPESSCNFVDDYLSEPIVVITDHPQGRTVETTQAWLRACQTLLENRKRCAGTLLPVTG